MISHFIQLFSHCLFSCESYIIICICVGLQGTNWTEEIRYFQERQIDIFGFMRVDWERYSCGNRCGVDERNASDILSSSGRLLCFCDKFCDEYGDCCFDFNKL